MDPYREHILDHYKHPRNYGSLDVPDGTAELANSSCGDTMKVDIRIREAGGIRYVEDMRFSGIGCAISMASASLLTEFVIGKPVSSVRALGLEDVRKFLHTDLTPSRVRCALLPLEAMQKALSAAGV